MGIERKEKIDELEEKARTGHIKRMQAGDCVTKVASSVYIDVVDADGRYN